MQPSPRASTSSKRISSGSGELKEILDSELLRALAEVPQVRLANIDEAFALLDSGLGAVFSVSMQRRAAMQRSRKASKSPMNRHEDVGGSPKSSASNNDTKALAGFGEALPTLEEKPKEKERGKSMLKNAVSRIGKSIKLHNAQKVTMQFMNELILPGDPESPGYKKGSQNDKDADKFQFFTMAQAKARSKEEVDITKCSTSSLDAIFSSESGQESTGNLHAVQEGLLEPGHRLMEDVDVRRWAKEQLALPEERLTGLESSATFRKKLGHHMLCWEAIHSNKLNLPPGGVPEEFSPSTYDDEARFMYDSLLKSDSTQTLAMTDSTMTLPLDSESSTSSLCLPIQTRRVNAMKPSPALITAAKSLFGLTHHLDANRNRRSVPREPKKFSRSGGNPDALATRTHVPMVGAEKLQKRHVPLTARVDGQEGRCESSSSGSNTAPSIAGSLLSIDVMDHFETEAEHAGEVVRLANKWSHRLPSFGQARDGAPGISLRRPPAFVEPHCNVMSTDVGSTPEFAYLRRCEHAGIVPCPAVWRRFSTNLAAVEATKRSLTDADICAIVETAVRCADQGHEFKILDLSNNILTDSGLSSVARCLRGPPAACTGLTYLSLAGNTMLRLKSESVRNDLASALEALPQLSFFDLSRVPLAGHPMIHLAAALRKCTSLKHLTLADCGLGRMTQKECESVAELFEPHMDSESSSGLPIKNEGLETIDLSANYFGNIGFKAVAAALARSKVQKISFANNGGMHMLVGQGEQQCRFHPIQIFIEGLLLNKSLEEIDLSNCGIGPDTAFVLEDALQLHPRMRHLELADNPLGDAGLRAIVRLLTSSGSTELHQCNVGGHREPDASANNVKLQYVHPGGIYSLNLEYPHERAVLRALLRVAAKKAHSGSRGGYLKHFKFDSKHSKPNITKEPVLDRWIVPTSGIFTFSFQPPMSEAVCKHQQQLHAQKEASCHANAPANETLSSQGLRALKHLKDIGFGGFGGLGGTHSSAHGSGSESPQRQIRFDGAVVPETSLSSIASAATFKSNHFRTSFGSMATTLTSRSVGTADEILRSKARALCLPDTRLGRGTTRCPWVPPEDTFDVDHSEPALLIKNCRMQVTSLRYPTIRKMFLTDTTRDQQLRFIRALSKDLGFNAPQIMQLCEDRPELAVHLVTSLFPGVRARSSQLTIINNIDAKNVPNAMNELRDHLWFQEGNVTGQYHLDLARPADYAVAENCLIVNSWESEVARAQGRPDISQRGNYEMLRNELHNETPFAYSREWTLPFRGFLRFDYSSQWRPPPGAQPMTEAGEMSKYLRSTAVSSSSKLRALRAVSIHVYLSTQQLRHLMHCFAEGVERQDFFCMLHTRVIDPARLLGVELLHSPNIFRPQDRVALMKRVGHLQLLNPMHPEGTSFTCNLMVYEERTVLDFLVQLTVKEPRGRVVGSSINNDKYATASPSWADKGVPEEDVVFSCCYQTANINLAWRHMLAEQYCGPHFKDPAKESKKRTENPSPTMERHMRHSGN